MGGVCCEWIGNRSSLARLADRKIFPYRPRYDCSSSRRPAAQRCRGDIVDANQAFCSLHRLYMAFSVMEKSPQQQQQPKRRKQIVRVPEAFSRSLCRIAAVPHGFRSAGSECARGSECASRGLCILRSCVCARARRLARSNA